MHRAQHEPATKSFSQKEREQTKPLEQYFENHPGRGDVIKAARRAGVAEVEDVFSTRRAWHVTGVDSDGRDISLAIHWRTGEVISIARGGY